LKDDDLPVTLERALEVIEARRWPMPAASSGFGIDDIQVLNGRYGPYVTDRPEYARSKDRDPNVDAR
jgi:DNA topoisomerase-1